MYRFCVSLTLHAPERTTPEVLRRAAAFLAEVPTVIATWQEATGRAHAAPQLRKLPADLDMVPKANSEMRMIREAINSHFMLLTLSEAARAAIADTMRPVSYPLGSHIIRQGDAADRWYILSEGLCGVYIAEAGKRAVTLIGQGAVFGGECFKDSNLRSLAAPEPCQLQGGSVLRLARS